MRNYTRRPHTLQFILVKSCFNIIKKNSMKIEFNKININCRTVYFQFLWTTASKIGQRFTHWNMKFRNWLRSKSVTENALNNKICLLTTSHFFPSRQKLGGLSTGIDDATPVIWFEGALKGAGPVRKVVFLWVCISEVTFFKSGNNK